MRIYLDNCVFNRPFDNQRQIRVRLESEAKLYIQDKIKRQEVELVWSYILDFENDQNPFKEKRATIAKWVKFAIVDIEETPELLQKANFLVTLGVKPKDALHVSSAISGRAQFFVSTDDSLLHKLKGFDEITAINPIDMAGIIDDQHNE